MPETILMPYDSGMTVSPKHLEITHHDEVTFVGQYIREAIFGLQDGIVSTFGVITGVAIGLAHAPVVIFTGLVVVAVESSSMAIGTYLSTKAQQDIYKRWEKEEHYQVHNNPEWEKQELMDFYKAKGFKGKLLKDVVAFFMKDKKRLLNEMMIQELKLSKEDFLNPVLAGAMMFFAYILGGLVALSSYLLFPVPLAIKTSGIVCIGSIFIAGILVSRYSKRFWLKSGLEFAVLTFTSGAIGYGIGFLAKTQFGINL